MVSFSVLAATRKIFYTKIFGVGKVLFLIYFLTIFSKAFEISQKLRSHILGSDFGFNSKLGCGKLLCIREYAQFIDTKIRPSEN